MLTSGQKCRKVTKRPDFIVSVLVPAHAKRVSVSRVRDFKRPGVAGAVLQTPLLLIKLLIN